MTNIYQRARAASIVLAQASRAQKDRALAAMAAALVSRAEAVLAANALDVEVARNDGTPESTVDRLALSETRIAGMAEGLRQIAALPDPVGEVVRGNTLANGL